MNTLLFTGILLSLYGILGLCGVQRIPAKYEGKSWTKKYIRCRGVSWLLLGLPWICFYLVSRNMNIDNFAAGVTVIVISIPAVIYVAVYDRKFNAMLKNDQE